MLGANVVKANHALKLKTSVMMDMCTESEYEFALRVLRFINSMTERVKNTLTLLRFSEFLTRLVPVQTACV